MRWLLPVAVALAGCQSERAETTTTTAAPTPTASSAAAGEPEPPRPPRVPCEGLDAKIELASLKRHLDNFMQIAKQHDNNRGRASGGYAASVSYVLSELQRAQLSPQRDGFDVQASETVGPGVLRVTQPEARKFLPARNRMRTGDFTPLSGSPPGGVTAEVAAVGVELGIGNESDSGCVTAHFDNGAGGSLVAGKVALLQRGGCSFVEKVRNAQGAGAVAVLVFNQGNTHRRRGLLVGSLDGRGADPGVRIPVMLSTTAVGEHLLAQLDVSPVELELGADTRVRLDRVHSVIVDIPGERDNEVLVLGGHLDSVEEGPGINDNASGAATLLELARHLSRCRLQRTVRIALWGGEEEGLLGSTAYVRSLSQDQLASIVGYINLDMLAAPNFAYMLTDGDGSMTGRPAPRTSGELEAFFREDFKRHNHGLVEVVYAGRSDDKPFYNANVGVVMLGAGYDGHKTAAQAREFGGRPDKPFDPCYHRACDDMSNVSLEALEVITQSVARAAETFAVDGTGLKSPVR